jgi:hypothetical protein
MNWKILAPAVSILIGVLAVTLQLTLPKGLFPHQDVLSAVAGVAMVGAIALGILSYRTHKRLSLLYIIIGLLLLLAGLLLPALSSAKGTSSAGPKMMQQSCGVPAENQEKARLTV